MRARGGKLFLPAFNCSLMRGAKVTVIRCRRRGDFPALATAVHSIADSTLKHYRVRGDQSPLSADGCHLLRYDTVQLRSCGPLNIGEVKSFPSCGTHIQCSILLSHSVSRVVLSPTFCSRTLAQNANSQASSFSISNSETTSLNVSVTTLQKTSTFDPSFSHDKTPTHSSEQPNHQKDLLCSFCLRCEADRDSWCRIFPTLALRKSKIKICRTPIIMAYNM